MSSIKSTRRYPDFEQPIVEIQDKIDTILELDEKNDDKLKNLYLKKDTMIKKVFKHLTAWQKVQLARHPMRPYTLDYINGIFEDFTELHGDRKFGDDSAIVGGIASLNNSTVMVIGHQKGRNNTDSVHRNYGMPHPEGYRKALRLMKIAEKFSIPVITFIDTSGAFPGIKAEERGQSEAIATNLKEMSSLKVPVIVVVIGEGGSGGALGIGVGDKILMLENSVYFVCTPEACSAILWRDSTKAELASDYMRLTAEDLKKLGVIDEIVKEPLGGAHWNYEEMFKILKKSLLAKVADLKKTKFDKLPESRYKKFRSMGVVKT